MALAFHCVQDEITGRKAGAVGARLTELACLYGRTGRRLRVEFDRLNKEGLLFDPDRPFMLSPPPEARGERYPEWVRAFLVDDLAASQLGLLQSPYKAALEVCRDLRDVIRYAVDFDGLTDASHREFYSSYAPLFNRLVGGPVMGRNRELIALLDAGIVRLPGGRVMAVSQSPGGQRRLRLVQADPDCARFGHCDEGCWCQYHPG
jgi:hypothetical protein